jgi:hypothetical protein
MVEQLLPLPLPLLLGMMKQLEFSGSVLVNTVSTPNCIKGRGTKFLPQP